MSMFGMDRNVIRDSDSRLDPIEKKLGNDPIPDKTDRKLSLQMVDVVNALKGQGQQFDVGNIDRPQLSPPTSCASFPALSECLLQGISHKLAEGVNSFNQNFLNKCNEQSALSRSLEEQAISYAEMMDKKNAGKHSPVLPESDGVLEPDMASQLLCDELMDTLKQARLQLEETPSQQQRAIEVELKKNDPNVKTLPFLMALIAQLIDKSASDELGAAADLKQKLSEMVAKEAENNAKEYDTQVRKAEDLHKIMGGVGKALGWLIVLGGFVGALFSGGASLVLASVGLALAIGDEVDQDVNGKSFIQEAMNPIIDNTMKPLMEKLGSLITESLIKHQHVKKDTAEMAGNILGAIFTAVIVISSVFIAGKGGMKAGQKIMEKYEQQLMNSVVVKLFQRLMDSNIVKTLQRVTEGIGNRIGVDEVKIERVINSAQRGMVLTSMVNTTIQISGDIVSSNMSLKAAKARSHMIQDSAVQDLLNQILDIMINNFTHLNEMTRTILEQMSAAAENQTQTGKYITNQMRAVSA